MANRCKSCSCGGIIRVIKSVKMIEMDSVIRYQRVKCDTCDKEGSQTTSEKIIWDVLQKESFRSTPPED